jgi:hypothetical protein
LLSIWLLLEVAVEVRLALALVDCLLDMQELHLAHLIQSPLALVELEMLLVVAPLQMEPLLFLVLFPLQVAGLA